MARRDQMDKKRKERKPVMYERLTVESSDDWSDEGVRRGYIPMLVGSEAATSERFLVHMRLFKNPCMAVLLEMAEQEFGYRQEGILKIPCDAEHFRQVIDLISKTR